MFFAASCDKDEKPDTISANEAVDEVEKPSINPDKPDKEEEKADTSLAVLKEEISKNGAKIGIAYLGCFEETFDATKDYFKYLGIYEDYSFVEEMSIDDLIINENNEMYLVVPADNAEVSVYDAILNEELYELEKGELLGKAVDGKPFLLLCNVSEIIPNVILETDEFEYIPFLSGENGEIVGNEAVYDFSPYEKIREYFDIQNGLADGADPIFCGSWIGEAEDGDLGVNTLFLTLNVDGTATYIYGIGNSEPTEGFTGEWSYDSDRDMILLDMFGGPYNDYLDSEEIYIDPHDLECGFKWDMDYRDDGTYLVLTHEEGDPILWGKNGATFELAEVTVFEEESYNYLIGSWGILSEKSETYLELFPDGSAHYYVIRDGATEQDLRGSWYAEALTLYLNLGWDDSTEDFALFGAYGIMYDGELLTLSILDDFANPLTAFMADNGYDSFILCSVG